MIFVTHFFFCRKAWYHIVLKISGSSYSRVRHMHQSGLSVIQSKRVLATVPRGSKGRVSFSDRSFIHYDLSKEYITRCNKWLVFLNRGNCSRLYGMVRIRHGRPPPRIKEDTFALGDYARRKARYSPIDE